MDRVSTSCNQKLRKTHEHSYQPFGRTGVRSNQLQCEMFSHTCHMYEISRVQLNSPDAKWGQTYTQVYRRLFADSQAHEWNHAYVMIDWLNAMNNDGGGFDWICHCWQWIMTVEGWPKSFYARTPSEKLNHDKSHGESCRKPCWAINTVAGHGWHSMTMSHRQWLPEIAYW